MFIGPNLWQSAYKARTEQSTVEYILASHFDDIFVADLKESFENCLRVDSGNTLISPFNFGNYRAINLGAPVNDADAANKKYVGDQIYKFEGITNNTAASGTIALETNKMYSMQQTGAITFTLPAPSNTNILNQIIIDFKSNGSVVNLGAANYFDKLTPVIAANNAYTLIYEYSNRLGAWVLGVLIFQFTRPQGARLNQRTAGPARINFNSRARKGRDILIA